MAALVAHNNAPILPTPPPAGAGVAKRYRPAPAKTFQCRGYGECRMVFSRSEHLARHVRKHTGERPFTCHCSKQFSRLDNLRQHAQTVHSDKQEQNERMMRDLTSLHASMAAANKAGQPRGKRGQAALNVAAAAPTNPSQDNGMRLLDHIKEEDINHASIPMHQRPGTSTGYEAGDSVMYDDGWGTDVDRGDPRPPNNHSFRDSSQSFRVPPASTSSTLYGQQSQSFLAFSNPLNLGIASRDARPGSSNSRPPTAGGPDSIARTLPPLAAVVSATIPSQSSQPFSVPPQSSQHILPLPGAAAFRRPSTANRPGTAPASYFGSKPAYNGGPGLVHQPDLSLPIYGRNSELAAAAAATVAAYQHNPFEADPPSPTTGSYDSPFSFHPPALAESATYGGAVEPSPGNPRKRPLPGIDGPQDEGPRRESNCGLSGSSEYEYGSESRPQSRRLTVLELCNEDADGGVRSFLPGAAGSASRPTTSSGLVSSASALALVDRTPLASHSLLPGAQPTAATAVAPGTPSATGPTAFAGGRVSPAVQRDTPSPCATAAITTAQLLAAHRGSWSASPLSDASRSPRSQPTTNAFAAVARSVAIHSNTPSPSSNAATSPTLHHRGEPQREVRSPVGAAFSPAAVGMRV
ncbi:hypothetical protein HD554DRAFT_2017943 [Boletus coccyginus]|nr:hypothetical protein HD554DRAFT_2017943 [Boletus coccyginus]